VDGLVKVHFHPGRNEATGLMTDTQIWRFISLRPSMWSLLNQVKMVLSKTCWKCFILSDQRELDSVKVMAR